MADVGTMFSFVSLFLLRIVTNNRITKGIRGCLQGGDIVVRYCLKKFRQNSIKLAFFLLFF